MFLSTFASGAGNIITEGAPPQIVQGNTRLLSMPTRSPTISSRYQDAEEVLVRIVEYFSAVRFAAGGLVNPLEVAVVHKDTQLVVNSGFLKFDVSLQRFAEVARNPPNNVYYMDDMLSFLLFDRIALITAPPVLLVSVARIGPQSYAPIIPAFKLAAKHNSLLAMNETPGGYKDTPDSLEYRLVAIGINHGAHWTSLVREIRKPTNNMTRRLWYHLDSAETSNGFFNGDSLGWTTDELQRPFVERSRISKLDPIYTRSAFFLYESVLYRNEWEREPADSLTANRRNWRL